MTKDEVISELTKELGRKPTDDEVLWVFKIAGVEGLDADS